MKMLFDLYSEGREQLSRDRDDLQVTQMEDNGAKCCINTACCNLSFQMSHTGPEKFLIILCDSSSQFLFIFRQLNLHGIDVIGLVNDAKLTAENSEAVCIEGLNSLSLTNCDLSGHIQENEQNDCDWTVILYQSMSGDSEVGNAVLNMTGGSLTSENGGLFYTTNTESTFYLNNVNITPSSNNEFFLKCTGNANKRGWGQSGANGADCSFTAENQKMEGDVVWDSISNLKFKMTEGSILTGGFIQDESCAGNGGSGTADLSIDAASTWIVTKDSRLSGLTNKGTIKDADGKAVTIKGSNGTVYVQGDSAYTVTVDSYTA